MFVHLDIVYKTEQYSFDKAIKSYWNMVTMFGNIFCMHIHLRVLLLRKEVIYCLIKKIPVRLDPAALV